MQDVNKFIGCCRASGVIATCNVTAGVVNNKLLSIRIKTSPIVYLFIHSYTVSSATIVNLDVCITSECKLSFLDFLTCKPSSNNNKWSKDNPTTHPSTYTAFGNSPMTRTNKWLKPEQPTQPQANHHRQNQSQRQAPTKAKQRRRLPKEANTAIKRAQEQPLPNASVNWTCGEKTIKRQRNKSRLEKIMDSSCWWTKCGACMALYLVSVCW